MAALVLATSGVASAASKMPQMNFTDPLTLAQVVWMAVIMFVLYILMARWALPRIGQVIENRKRRIDNDLEAASQLRRAADQTVEELDRAVRNARDEGQATIAKAVSDAKEKMRAETEILNARLEAEWARVEEEIEQARRAGAAVLRPVAEDLVVAVVEKLMGRRIDGAMVARALDMAEQ